MLWNILFLMMNLIVYMIISALSSRTSDCRNYAMAN